MGAKCLDVLRAYGMASLRLYRHATRIQPLLQPEEEAGHHGGGQQLHPGPLRQLREGRLGAQNA